MSFSSEHSHEDTPAKRRRDDLEFSPTEIIKDEWLYFENGTIVLLSRPNENIITAFKFYKELLLNYSPIFKSMFSVPVRSDVETYDGVTLVRLDDEASDMIPFLNAICDVTMIPSKRDFYFSFCKVERVVKLSKKYQCEKLLTCLRGTLSSIWPKDLSGWDDFPAHNFDKDHQKRQHESAEEYVIRSTLPEPCSMIYLARELDVPAILPAAFYRLFCLSPGTLGGLPPKKQDWGVHFDQTPKFKYLAHEDPLRCLGAHYKSTFFMESLYINASITAVTCQQTRLCSKALVRLVEHQKDTADCMDVDALSLLYMWSIRIKELKLCGLCQGRYVSLMRERRTMYWSSLPDFFKLGIFQPFGTSQ